MKDRKLFMVIGLGLSLLIIWIVVDTFNQPGVSDLEGSFEQTAFYRNENNTGPIIRIYAVYSSESSPELLEQYASMMPHTKYGTTKVYFFDQKEKAPNIVLADPPHFDPETLSHCIAFFEKTAMGQVKFIQHPFKN